MKKLRLNRRVLRELDLQQLGSVRDVRVAGGAPPPVVQSIKCPTTYTLIMSQCNCTGYYPSLNAPCTQ